MQGCIYCYKEENFQHILNIIVYEYLMENN